MCTKNRFFKCTVFISRLASPVSWLMQDAPSQVLIVFKTTYLSYECCISCVKAKYEIQGERMCLQWEWRLDTCAFNINPLFVGKLQLMSAGEKTRHWWKDLLKEQMCICDTFSFISPIAPQPFFPKVSLGKASSKRTNQTNPSYWCHVHREYLLWQSLSPLFMGRRYLSI